MDINYRRLPIVSIIAVIISIGGLEASSRLHSQLPAWLVNVIEGFLVFSFWIALALIVNFLIDRFLWPRLFGPNIPGQPRQRKLVMELVHVTTLGIAVGMAMKQLLSPELATMVTGSGVIAIVLGLALQSTLGDFFAGVALNLERPFKAGEWITLEDKTEGLVLSVNWRATHIKTRTHDVLIVPNSVVAKGRLTNRFQPTPLHIAVVHVKLMPGFDLDLFQRVVTRAVLTVKGVKDSPPPMALVDVFGDWTVAIRTFYAIDDYNGLLLIQGEVSNAVYKAIAAEEGLRKFWPRVVVAQAGSTNRRPEF